ncbi:MAG: SprB repeat-containing protein [Bacteroidetes bacterium]|nr:SprB repeat-containing protein [Bacteroidota bacterium]
MNGPLATCSGTDVLCNGGSDGSASVTATGGTAPYTYLWSNGSTDASITGLTAGSYTVTVTDATGCISSCTHIVGEPTALTATCSATDASCGLATGTAMVVAADGTAPYSYSWSNGSTDASITGLAAGVYTATVTDANGCIATCESTVNNLNGPVITCSSSDVTCNGGADGEASVSVSGGVGPLTFLWSNGSTDASITGLTAGSYTVTVTDGNGCVAMCTSTITEPTALTATCSATDASCGAATGTAMVVAADGTAPYSYSWSNGSTDASITGLTAGVYSHSNRCKWMHSNLRKHSKQLERSVSNMLRNRCSM